MESITVRRDDYEISSDRKRLDRSFIGAFLADVSYWARDIPREVVDRSIEHSLCFGVYHRDGPQVGFARAITDCATFARLADIFIEESHRGRGLGKWLVETVLAHPGLAGLRMISLGTQDAHALYERYGFVRVADTALAGTLMVIHCPDVYKR
ncbi:MAG: GNAT family N-acetyltransferase [Deltaproteobacteria bacterium]|nr:GNAT family N-acetyltransferase [Candidatus Zymogenaceae bacterium]